MGGKNNASASRILCRARARFGRHRHANAADKPIVGLITKTNTNPFFVKMKAGAEEAATANGIELRSFAGKVDGDNDSQVAAIENLITAGAKGILITPNDFPRHRASHRQGTRRRHFGDCARHAARPGERGGRNLRHRQFHAGELIGQWAVKTLGPKATSAKIAMLDLNVNQISVDVARDQGFLKGFGIDLGNRPRSATRRMRASSDMT